MIDWRNERICEGCEEVFPLDGIEDGDFCPDCERSNREHDLADEANQELADRMGT